MYLGKSIDERSVSVLACRSMAIIPLILSVCLLLAVAIKSWKLKHMLNEAEAYSNNAIRQIMIEIEIRSFLSLYLLAVAIYCVVTA